MLKSMFLFLQNALQGLCNANRSLFIISKFYFAGRTELSHILLPILWNVARRAESTLLGYDGEPQV